MALPEVSIITTCKGRRAHLEQSLPLMLVQHRTEVVVVDYDCPEGTADWVRAAHPAARVVKVDDHPRFHGTHARNLGAAAARGNWFFFLDADVLVAPDLIEKLAPSLTLGRFFRPSPVTMQTWGSVLVSARDFQAIGGYDEVITGYGGEDDDLFLRLVQAGVDQASYPAAWLGGMDHSDDMRTRYYLMADKQLSQRCNSFYVALKSDVQRMLGRALSREERQALFDEAHKAIEQAGPQGAGRVEVTLPPQLAIPVQRGWALRRSVVLTLAPMESGGLTNG